MRFHFYVLLTIYHWLLAIKNSIYGNIHHKCIKLFPALEVAVGQRVCTRAGKRIFKIFPVILRLLFYYYKDYS